MLQKICPTCRRTYDEIERYCTECGIMLFKVPNRCTAGKTRTCQEREYRDGDKYCSMCGSPTTYWVEKLIKEKDGCLA